MGPSTARKRFDRCSYLIIIIHTIRMGTNNEKAVSAIKNFPKQLGQFIVLPCVRASRLRCDSLLIREDGLLFGEPTVTPKAIRFDVLRQFPEKHPMRKQVKFLMRSLFCSLFVGKDCTECTVGWNHHCKLNHSNGWLEDILRIVIMKRFLDRFAISTSYFWWISLWSYQDFVSTNETLASFQFFTLDIYSATKHSENTCYR